MNIILDIETNRLVSPDKIWLVVCKDIDSNTISIFKNLTENLDERERFKAYVLDASLVIGHNILEFDLPVLSLLVGLELRTNVCDTLILSKLVNYSRPGGHSLAQYGEEHGLEKITYSNWSGGYTKELEDYCIRDVEINHLVFNVLRKYWDDPTWHNSIELEHSFQRIVNDLHRNGFAFDTPKAENLLVKVKDELAILDKEIKDAFPPQTKIIREVHPRVTKYNTLNKGDFRFVKGGDLSEFNGGPFSRFTWVDFNPASHKQVIEVLHRAMWVPTVKTNTHKDVEREINRLKYRKGRDNEIDNHLKMLYDKYNELKKFGWKICEENLNTLPVGAPAPARTLARRILVESRRRALVEWLGLVQDDGRIHGRFYGIGAWTHRMAHQEPNTANIPTDAKLYGKEMRSLWRAPRNRLLVGVDAEGIQLRIFAHYVNDPELTESLINGNKADHTDPHSLNQRVLGSICKNRQAAKRFLYSLLLGGGVNKFSEILECTREQAMEAVITFNKRYPGFDYLKRELIPSDAKKGFFTGLDGRRVPISGTTEGDRRHLAMSGYLQNGEAIIMKKAAVRFSHELQSKKALLVNFVHDEWQTEVPNNMATALEVAGLQARALREAGEELELNCPMQGSYWNDDRKDYTIGTNWYVTH